MGACLRVGGARGRRRHVATPARCAQNARSDARPSQSSSGRSYVPAPRYFARHVAQSGVRSPARYAVFEVWRWLFFFFIEIIVIFFYYHRCYYYYYFLNRLRRAGVCPDCFVPSFSPDARRRNDSGRRTSVFLRRVVRFSFYLPNRQKSIYFV